MSYKALYNKYRSQTFDELVGQEAVVTTLKNALKTNKISHAYLFSGPRGTGKTSVARLFSKALNCEEGLGHQCNKCDNCKLISEGNHPDVVEIDAASNSGVDEVRNLIDNVKYAPIKGRYKIYIIDEVHMMTNSAFNALLKTLEEPPEYVIFILCTTEPYKLLPTILSRCQRFEFKKISSPTLKELVTRVLKNENIKAEDEAINLIVELADGGARDALSILDQLIAYSGDLINVKDIESVFGLTSKNEKIEMLTYISKKDTLSLLNFYNKINKRNVDIERLNNELLDVLKDTLIYEKIKGTSLLEVASEEEVKTIASLFNETKLTSMIDQLLKCQNDFRTTNNPNFLFQIYLLKLLDDSQNKEVVYIKEATNPAKEVGIKPVETQTLTNEIKVMKEAKTVNAPKVEEKKPEYVVNDIKDLSVLPPLFSEEKKGETVVEKSPLVTEGEAYSVDNETLIKIMVSGNKAAREELMKRWQYLDIFKNDKDLGPFAMLLKDGMPYVMTENILVVSFNFEIQAFKCDIKANQNDFEKVLNKLIGKNIFIYGINRKVLNDITHEFLNLKQVNKLPKVEEIGEIKINK
jgi:DNA polymerase III, subunit gamma and tau